MLAQSADFGGEKWEQIRDNIKRYFPHERVSAIIIMNISVYLFTPEQLELILEDDIVFKMFMPIHALPRIITCLIMEWFKRRKYQMFYFLKPSRKFCLKTFDLVLNSTLILFLSILLETRSIYSDLSELSIYSNLTNF